MSKDVVKLNWKKLSINVDKHLHEYLPLEKYLKIRGIEILWTFITLPARKA